MIFQDVRHISPTPKISPSEVKPLPGKDADPDVRKVRRQEEKGTTEDEMVGQCHRSDHHEFDPILGGSGRQEGLQCSGPWGHKESDMTLLYFILFGFIPRTSRQSLLGAAYMSDKIQ